MPFVGIGVRVGGNSARTSYAKQLAKAYEARVIADGGVVESLGCFTAFATSLGAFKPTLLLDFYQNAAAAYSLRKLSTTYTGDAIRVRRASDNTELNIGFVNNELDTATLESFCSGTNGFVTTWYDQSGNARNATKSTAANQPQIVSGGSVTLDNVLPALTFGTTLSIAAGNLSSSTDCDFFAVYKVSGDSVFATNGGTSTPYYLINVSGQTSGAFAVAGTPTVRVNASAVSPLNRDTLNTALGVTQKLVTVESADFSGQTTFEINGFGGLAKVATVQELIIYASDQSSNRNNIETNINSYYGIY